MKKFFVTFFIIFLFQPVSAHEIKTVGSLNILLHMEPQDSPVVGESAQLFLSVDDTQKKFSIADCDCKVEIEHEDMVMHTETVIPQPDFGFNVGLLNFTFPQKGIYNVKFSGTSKAGLFESFALDYDVRIERESISQAPVDPVVPKNNFLYFYWGGLGIIVLCAIIFIVIRVKRNEK